jgi:hypothetical protein
MLMQPAGTTLARKNAQAAMIDAGDEAAANRASCEDEGAW